MGPPPPPPPRTICARISSPPTALDRPSLVPRPLGTRLGPPMPATSSPPALTKQRAHAHNMIHRRIQLPHPGYCKSCKKLMQTSPFSSHPGFHSTSLMVNTNKTSMASATMLRLSGSIQRQPHGKFPTVSINDAGTTVGLHQPFFASTVIQYRGVGTRGARGA